MNPQNQTEVLGGKIAIFGESVKSGIATRR